MLIIPAIDIRNGKCVRLRQGNYSDEIIYGEEPVVVAQKWLADGAQALHLVDLDGAKRGQLINYKVIEEITRISKVPVQVGGGIQTAETIKKLLSIGVNKVIIGTLALENESLFTELLSAYADQITVSLDSKNGILAKRGWLESTKKGIITTARKLEDQGVKSFIYTDVLKDGTLTQPDYDGIKELLDSVEVPLIVAGGVSSISDIEQLKLMKVAGVIVGKALYEGKINIREANYVS